MRILIVDDHLAFRKNMVSLLITERGFEVVGEAGTCAEALNKTRELKPDLILLDISLPDGNGLDLMKDILSHSPETKVVLLTVHDTDDFLLKAIRSGARGYLLKGLEFANMLAALKALDRSEFVLSPKMAQLVLSDYSRIRAALDRGFDLGKLTPRQRDVLRLLCLGATNREIARYLVISENTVRVHVQNIFKKLNLKNRRDAREKYHVVLGLENPVGNLLFQLLNEHENQQVEVE